MEREDRGGKRGRGERIEGEGEMGRVKGGVERERER